jgi:uncharacterized protein
MIKHKFLVIVFLMITISSFSQYTIETIPDPKKQGQNSFVSDPDGILGLTTVDALNQICVDVEQQSSAEVAIVAVDDFEGASDFDFAYELFNHWGIGKAGNNNGLLVFIARNRRKYQFITGLGMEGSLPDVTLSTIGERYLVPRFKQGDYGGGLIDAMNAIKNVLENPEVIKDLKVEAQKNSFLYKNGDDLLSAAIVILVFVAIFYWLSSFKKHLPLSTGKNNYKDFIGGCAIIFVIVFFGFFVVAFFGIDAEKLLTIQAVPWIAFVLGTIFLLSKYISQRQNIINAYKDEANIVAALGRYEKRYWILALICPLLIFFIIGYLRRKNQLKQRLQPPDHSGKWIRLNRDEIKGITAYLSDGQIQEEKIRSVSYEIWQQLDNASIQLVKWNGRKFNRYEDCPRCENRTLNKVYTKTITAATYSSTGLGEKIQDCTFCKYKQSFGTVILPKLQKSSSSGSGGSRSSSSASSGSWGGGRSGGGGAGGSW